MRRNFILTVNRDVAHDNAGLCGSGKIEVQLNGSKVRGAGDRN